MKTIWTFTDKRFPYMKLSHAGHRTFSVYLWDVSKQDWYEFDCFTISTPKETMTYQQAAVQASAWFDGAAVAYKVEDQNTPVFLLYTTDEWCSRDSHTLRGTFGVHIDVIKAIRDLVKNDVIDETVPVDDAMSVEDINAQVEYIYVRQGFIGEFEAKGGMLL